MKWLALLIVLTPAAAGAQEVDYVMPRIPTEAEKIDALKLGYLLNNNSMVGPTIDLTGVRVTATVPVKPDAPPVEAVKPKHEKKAEADTCTRHGLRKVIKGTSWRCK